MAFVVLVNACQCFSRVVKYFTPQRGDAKDGRLLIFIPLVDWSVAPLVSGCHSFLECMSVIVKGFQGLSSILHLKGGTYAKGGRLLIFISSVDWSFVFGFSVVFIPF